LAEGQGSESWRKNFSKVYFFKVSLRDLVSKSSLHTIISTPEESRMDRVIMNDVFKNMDNAFEAVRRERLRFV
jgi:hypothetical protein